MKKINKRIYILGSILVVALIAAAVLSQGEWFQGMLQLKQVKQAVTPVAQKPFPPAVTQPALQPKAPALIQPTPEALPQVSPVSKPLVSLADDSFYVGGFSNLNGSTRTKILAFNIAAQGGDVIFNGDNGNQIQVNTIGKISAGFADKICVLTDNSTTYGEAPFGLGLMTFKYPFSFKPYSPNYTDKLII